MKRTAFVTGGASGIGLSICEHLALPVVPARPRNRTATPRTSELLASRELQDLVGGLYRKDYQVFGYDSAP